MLAQIEILLQLTTASVFFYDGKEVSTAIRNLRGAKGLALSNDQK